MEQSQLAILAERLAQQIERIQQRNRRARVSATRRRRRQWAILGIDPDKLFQCEQCSL